MAPAPREDLKPCRNKSKSAVALSEEEQAAVEADSAFLDLISSGDVSGVEKMIKEGQEVNVGDDSGESSCHKAMRLDDSVMLKALVRHGAHADYSDDYGSRPINIGMQMGEQADELVNYLLSLTDSKNNRTVELSLINPKTGNTLLHDAAWIGNTTACQALLKTGAFAELLEARNVQGQTAVQCAHRPLVEAPETPPPLLYCTASHSLMLIAFSLLRRSVAAFRAPKALVSSLVDAGADANAVEKNNRRLSKETPETMALAMGREDTAAYLRDLNTAVNAVKFGARMKMNAKNKE